MPTFCFLGSVGVGNDDDLPARVAAIAERVAGGCGLEVFSVRLRRESIGRVLRVVLDRPAAAEDSAQPVSVGDCEQVSRDLSAILDVEVTFAHPYTLEVSSPGLDRPLRHLGDCRRFIGRRAKIVTTGAVDGQHAWTGRIADVEGEDVIIDAADHARRIPWSLVSRARLEVDF